MMKNRYFIVVLCIFAMIAQSCKGRAENKQAVIEQKLQTGDLIFCGIPMDYNLNDSADMSGAIVEATGDSDEVNYIHVAIVEVDKEGKNWIIDATLKHGVDRYPIDTFYSDFRLKNGDYPQFDVMRLRDNKEAERYVEQAKKYIGRAYDLVFDPDNEEQYCSELVRNAYINADGNYLFDEKPMNFKNSDGEFPTYWVQLFKLMNQPIPQGVMGTNPNDMQKSDCLKNVMVLKPEK